MKKIFLIAACIIGTGIQNSLLSDIPDTTMQIHELGGVVIKATKENLNVRQFPASVSVMPTQSIENMEIKSINTLTSVVSNLFIPEYGSKLTSPIYIRGIGSRINAPSIGVYVDHVPYFDKAAANFDFYDIERIEVLRGPQGTLFGRNTMGGIINVSTLSPLYYQGTNVNATAASYGNYSGNVGYYGKFSEKFAMSLGGNYIYNDGFFTNAFSDEKVDQLNSYGVRNRLVFQPVTRWRLENIASYENSRQGGYPYAVFDAATNTVMPVNYDMYSKYDRQMLSNAFVANYFGNSFILTSTTSYQYLDDLQGVDQDFTPKKLYYINQMQNQNLLSQEIVLKSITGPRIDWLTGLYGFYQKFDNQVDADLFSVKTFYSKLFSHNISGGAVFAQGTAKNLLTEGLNLTAGLRVDYEKDAMQFRHDQKTPAYELKTLVDTTYNALLSTELMPKVSLSYSREKSNLYALIAKGYKTGGFNSTFERPEDITFDAEHSMNYEAGFKTFLFNSKLYFDFAIFYIDWRNQQIYKTVPSGRGSMLKNAGHSESKGFETSVRSILPLGIEMFASYGYTDARFLDNKLNETVDYSGNFIPYAPKHTVALNLNKRFELNSGFLDVVDANLLYRGVGAIYWSERNDFKQPYYGLTDAKIGFEKKQVRLELWAKNLFDVDYHAFFFEALGNKYVQMGRPAQFGVNINMKFN